jgi:hypothetical protein
MTQPALSGGPSCPATAERYPSPVARHDASYPEVGAPRVCAWCRGPVPATARRDAAWHRGERPARSRWPLNAWEPVIYSGGRAADPSRPGALQSRRADSLVCGVSVLTTLPSRVTGTKPAAFCRWVFDLLGAAPGDTLDDLFPGSGAVTRAWAAYTGTPDPSCPARASRDASAGSARDASAEAPAGASCPTSGATDAEAAR